MRHQDSLWWSGEGFLNARSWRGRCVGQPARGAVKEGQGPGRCCLGPQGHGRLGCYLNGNGCQELWARAVLGGGEKEVKCSVIRREWTQNADSPSYSISLSCSSLHLSQRVMTWFFFGGGAVFSTKMKPRGRVVLRPSPSLGPPSLVLTGCSSMDDGH